MKRLAVFTLLAACASPQTSVVAGGEASPIATETAVAPAPVGTPVRVELRTASRSRTLSTPKARVTGTLTDTTCYSAAGSRTASGKWPRLGMAASNHYLFGTRLRVQGVGIVTVEDRIGWGSSLDLFGPSASYCRHFGRRLLRVEIVQ